MKDTDFNPHEREARDRRAGYSDGPSSGILIHTSVKLVTCTGKQHSPRQTILIHTSVKLVTP